MTREGCRRHIKEHLFSLAPSAQSLSTSSSPCSLGIEQEAFPYWVDPSDGRPRPVSFQGGDGSLAPALVRASTAERGEARYGSAGCGVLSASELLDAITFPEGDRFTFEPGAQVEMVTAPCRGLDEVAGRLGRMQDVLHVVTEQSGIHFAQVGAQPWFDSEEVGLQVPKPRFLAMDEYFEAIGPFGRRMMRQTCSVQVNFDLGCDPERFVRRFVAASLLAPFATAIFANSPVFAGKARKQRSYRSFLWRRLDPARTGIPFPKRVSRGLRPEDLRVADLVDAYTDFALRAPVIRMENGGEPWANHLSTLFPELRPRGHVEVRSLDALPVEWQLVPAAFYCGLLFSEPHLEQALDRLLPCVPNMDDLLEKAAWGLQSDELFSTAEHLMELAIEGFSSLPDDFKGNGHHETLVRFHGCFTARRRSPADGGFSEVTHEARRRSPRSG